MNANEIKVYVSRDGDTMYTRMPEKLEEMANRDEATECVCGRCDGKGRWDTLAWAKNGGALFIVHYPELENTLREIPAELSGIDKTTEGALCRTEKRPQTSFRFVNRQLYVSFCIVGTDFDRFSFRLD